MLRIFTYQDQAVLAGLTWGPSRPSSLLRRGPLAANDLALHWDDRTALVPEEPKYLGKASLLSVLAGHLSEEELIGRVFCAFVIAEQFLWFAAVLVNGKPAIGAERLFKTCAELITHIEVECSNGQIDRLAIDPALAEDIAEDVTRRIAGCYLCRTPARSLAASASGPTPNPVCVEGRIAPKHPVWQIAAGGGAAVLTLTAGILLWFAVQPSKPVALLPKAAVQTSFRDEIAFGQNCLAAFAGIWPQAPGWKLTSEGCATPEMRDPALTNFAPNHPVAYRIYQVRGGFDAAIARQAADAVYAQSAIDMLIRGNRLYSSFEIAVPLLKAATVPDQSAATSQTPVSRADTSRARVPLTPAALLAATEAVFLGLADRIVLDGGGNSAIGSSPKVRVTLKSGFEDIFERVRRIEGAEIARLSRSGETVTLEITTRQIVIAPMFLPISGLKTSHGKSAEKNTAQRGAAMQAVLPSAASHELDAAAETQKDKMI